MKNKKIVSWSSAIIVTAALLLFFSSSNKLFAVKDPDDPVNQHDPTPTVGMEDTNCTRPYTADSIWNVPIDWSLAKIHPENEAMMDAFFESANWIGSDTTQFAPPIYFVSSETPLVPVRLNANRFRDAINDVSIQYGAPGDIVWMPLPAGAVPAPGTDGQLAVINLDTGEEWGINKGAVTDAGEWTAGGAYRYHIENSGIPPEGFAQRGGGIGQFAGIVRRCEVERGRIDHAVTIAYDFPCEPGVCQANGWPAVIPPFTKTDGEGTSQFDIPEGARIAIRPEISLKEMRSACSGVKGCEVWLLSMQQYGGFIVDDSGHPKTYAEGNATANWSSAMWPADMLRNVPPDWYVVIDWNYPSTKVPQK
ncbi:MAG: hypothetical protein HZB19_19420 [Chloroflexi bacterium]|nr:hypothetical protein [Chloroflexota bacterium]